MEVIIGSTRPGRAGLPVGRWIAEYAARAGRFDVEIVDLAAIDRPMLGPSSGHRRLDQVGPRGLFRYRC